MTPPSLFCFGLGYVASHLSAALQGHMDVAGTHRQGPLTFDGTFNPDLRPHIHKATHILISIPPNPEGDLVLAHYREALVQAQPVWIGYLSSTSVYGDHQGEWVNERADCHPTTPPGLLRLKAEQQWLNFQQETGLPIHIFRLAGIYGPGRSLFDDLKAGTARHVVKPGHVFSRIHVADIVQTLLASIAAPAPGEIYNVSDNLPTTSADALAYACQISGLPLPPPVPFEEAPLSQMGRWFYQDCKRSCNRKIKKKLGIVLRYPTYKEGLAAVWECEGL
jgi:nucleoside-diphosphate-sugar epimerase